MDISPHDVQQGLGALRTAFEAVRAAVAAWKEARGLGKPSKESDERLEKALEEAERTIKIAEAESAKALGYELCRCEFPPNIMVLVGYTAEDNRRYVYKCSRCLRTSPDRVSYAPLKEPRTIVISRW
jgi:hypothetical protein